MNGRRVGVAGEVSVVDYLKEKGYSIIGENVKLNTGEADIIAEDNGVIVFVEVKARSTVALGTPAEAVGKSKQQRYRRIASEYVVRNRLAHRDLRFDVVEVVGGVIVNHIENAF